MSDSAITELLSQKPPRQEDLVAPFIRTFNARVKRNANVIGGVLLAIAAGTALIGLFAYTPTPHHDDDPLLMLKACPVILAIGGLFPAWAVRRILFRDVRSARAVLRDGTGYSARLSQHDRFPYGGMNIIDLAWEQNGERSRARFDLMDYPHPLDGNDEVAVVTCPKRREVVAFLGENGMVVGKRLRG